MLYITTTDNMSVWELMMQGMQLKHKSPVFNVIRLFGIQPYSTAAKVFDDHC